MKQCQSCKLANDNDAVFCEGCGQKLVAAVAEGTKGPVAHGKIPHFCKVPLPATRLRELGHAITTEYITPLRQTVASVLDELRDAERRVKALQSQVVSEFGRAKSHNQSLTGGGKKDITLQSFAGESAARRQRPTSEIWQEAEKHGHAAKKMCDEFLQSKRPNRGTVGCWSAIAGVVLWIAVGVAAKSEDIGFVAGAIAFVVIWVVVEASSSGRAHGQFNAIAQACGLATANAEAYLQRIRAELNQEIKNLAVLYVPVAQQFQLRSAEFMRALGLTGADWDDSEWQRWLPPSYSSSAVRIGTVRACTADLSPAIPDEYNKFTLPALLSFPGSKCLVFEAAGEERLKAIGTVQATMLRLLATTPPGKLRFTLIDPVGLGHNVAGFMGLFDHDEQLVTSQAWTQPQHIEQRLADITEHMETVIQKYLRDEFQTIEKYNAQALVPEPYRVIVIFDFPVNFNDDATRRLVSIAKNGSRCGVYTVVVRDTSKSLPYGFTLDDLQQEAVVIEQDKEYKERFVWRDDQLGSWFLELDGQPPQDVLQRVVEKVGAEAKKGAQVEVPFGGMLQMAELNASSWWKGLTKQRVEAPLGPAGARNVQHLKFGEGTAHHALIVGRTGSGKTNLMHVLINSLALTYPPEELELYLVDFKQGVAFKIYADLPLPHARVIAIESEREFGLSVLQTLDSEMLQRGEIFRRVGVEDITGYREKLGPPGQIPRKLMLVDEFQEFFTHDDSIAQEAARILDHIARQGRSHGIHLVLGSQTLTGSSSLAKSTLAQFGVRIALQCSEADSRLILADDNPAARLLSRPGEAIYNDASGLVEGNKLFQVARWDNSDKEQYLARVKSRFSERVDPRPIVFEGNESAQLEECAPLRRILVGGQAVAKPKIGEAWLGEPTAIKPPTVARFRHQTGSHLLIVMRDEKEAIGMLSSAFVSLLPQEPRSRYLIVDLTTADSDWSTLSDEFAGMSLGGIEVARRRGLCNMVRGILAEVQQRIALDSRGGPELYFMIWGLHRARDLRDDDLSSAADSVSEPSLQDAFATILREGPELGIHIIAWCDTVSNADRFLRGRLIGEFNMRVAGPMNINDSQTLLDDPAASKLDKPHRALFFDEDQPGRIEKFRPYGVPSKEFREQIALTVIERLPTT